MSCKWRRTVCHIRLKELDLCPLSTWCFTACQSCSFIRHQVTSRTALTGVQHPAQLVKERGKREELTNSLLIAQRELGAVKAALKTVREQRDALEAELMEAAFDVLEGKQQHQSLQVRGSINALYARLFHRKPSLGPLIHLIFFVHMR